MRSIFVIVLGLFFVTNVKAQIPTVGVLTHESGVSDGYVLLSPMSSPNTYLIDNCGRVAHKWESDYYPGYSVRLLKNGNLLRATQVQSGNFITGGAGGRIEIVNWDGEIVWEFFYSTSEKRQHHDILDLPNGNILILAWDAHNMEQAIQAGRNPEFLGEKDKDVWSEHLIEIKPIGRTGFEIVWEWYAWDHIIQDYDESKANFGIVADHPELINLNYIKNSKNEKNPDWIHANAINYNPLLDQIVISANKFSEFWIIDHSTTTEESRGSAGGNMGHGGDILYRYGNPMAYNRGELADRKYFGQHDVQWIEGEKKLVMLFNNGSPTERPFSTVDILEMPLNSEGQYYFEENLNVYGPIEPYIQYSSAEIPKFRFSNIVSGVQKLKNGNYLICSGVPGSIIEIEPSGNVVWEYRSPISDMGIVEQGFDYESSGTTNMLFRAYKYSPDYEGLLNKVLLPGNKIELNPITSFCDEVLSSYEDQRFERRFSIYPNPTTGSLNIVANDPTDFIYIIEIMDASGKIIKKYNLNNINRFSPNLDNYNNGLYFISLYTIHGKFQSKIFKR